MKFLAHQVLSILVEDRIFGHGGLHQCPATQSLCSMYRQNVLARTFPCLTCNRYFGNQAILDTHLLTQYHLTLVDEAQQGLVRPFRCKTCEIGFWKQSDLTGYNSTKLHLDKKRVEDAGGDPATVVPTKAKRDPAIQAQIDQVLTNRQYYCDDCRLPFTS